MRLITSLAGLGAPGVVMPGNLQPSSSKPSLPLLVCSHLSAPGMSRLPAPDVVHLARALGMASRPSDETLDAPSKSSQPNQQLVGAPALMAEVLSAAASAPGVAAQMNGKQLVDLAWGLAAVGLARTLPRPLDHKRLLYQTADISTGRSSSSLSDAGDLATGPYQAKSSGSSDIFPMIAGRFLEGSHATSTATTEDEVCLEDNADDDGSHMGDGSLGGSHAMLMDGPPATASSSPGANLRSLTPAYLSRLAWAMSKWVVHQRRQKIGSTPVLPTEGLAVVDPTDPDPNPDPDLRKPKRKSKRRRVDKDLTNAATSSGTVSDIVPSPCLDLLERLGKWVVCGEHDLWGRDTIHGTKRSTGGSSDCISRDHPTICITLCINY